MFDSGEALGEHKIDKEDVVAVQQGKNPSDKKKACCDDLIQQHVEGKENSDDHT